MSLSISTEKLKKTCLGTTDSFHNSTVPLPKLWEPFILCLNYASIIGISLICDPDDNYILLFSALCMQHQYFVHYKETFDLLVDLLHLKAVLKCVAVDNGELFVMIRLAVVTLLWPVDN